MKKILFLLLLFNFTAKAQNNFWVFSKENESERLKKEGYEVLYSSEWLNASVVKLTVQQQEEIKKLDYVLGLKSMGLLKSQAVTNELEPNFALKQIGLNPVKENTKLGKGVKIGIIDVGFKDADKSPFLSSIFSENRILGHKDFVDSLRADSLFYNEATKVDLHGTLVLSSIAGQLGDELLGFAPEASFYLARTDSGKREYRGEEYQWVAAIEWMHKNGVRLVNTSLGYASGFTDSTENYLPQNMNGKTSVIARAAEIAANEKDMILVVSAGNSGESSEWPIVSTPGDAENVITVGANTETGLKMGYSSIGAEFVDFLKPDLTAYSKFGTSLSAPIITGFIATMLDQHPDLSLIEIKIMLAKAGLFSTFPNNYVGSGYPNSEIVFQMLNQELIPDYVEEITAKKEITINSESAILFRKKDSIHVISQETLEAQDGKIIIKPVKNEKFTTILADDLYYEITWKK